MISIDKSVFNKLNNAPNASVIKLFFYIALNQPEEGICGYETTKQQLAIDLNCSLPNIFRSLRWLNREVLIHELKQVETVEFMVNPLYVMNNCDRQARIDEWLRRQRLDVARSLRLKKERRIRKLRNAKKQQNLPQQA